MRTFREDLKQAVAYHGHLCSGQYYCRSCAGDSYYQEAADER